MTTDRLALASVLRDNGIGDQRKAEAVATAIFDAINDSVVTKADLAALAASTKADIAGVRADIASLAAATKADLAATTAGLRTEIQATEAMLTAKITTVRAELEALPNALTLRLGTLMIVVGGVLFAALRYLPAPH